MTALNNIDWDEDTRNMFQGLVDSSTQNYYCGGEVRVINPRRACAARVTVLGLSVSQSVSQSVCLSTTILANSSSATSDQKSKWRFC